MNFLSGEIMQKKYFYCNFKIIIICVNCKLVMTGSKHQGDKVSNDKIENKRFLASSLIGEQRRRFLIQWEQYAFYGFKSFT